MAFDVADMTDQPSPNSKPLLKRNDRYILGAVIFAVLAVGLFLYATRKGDEPTNQFGITSAPETPSVPGAAGGKR
jgi:hypothetical protein